LHDKITSTQLHAQQLDCVDTQTVDDLLEHQNVFQCCISHHLVLLLH